MRSCYSLSALCGISRAAWRHAVAGTPRLGGGGHQQQQDNLRYLPFRSPAPPNALGLTERFFSSSSTKPSTKKSAASTKKSAAKKSTPVDSPAGDPFYVVRKGDVIGIYKNLADCQAQVSNSVCDPPVEPDGNATSTLERPQEMLKETGPLKKHPKVAKLEPLPDSHLSCILEFDGACKVNPGKSGAGVIVRQPDGSVIAQLREGLGIATCNTAEYRALLLGLRYAEKKGFKYIRAQGDSENVCKQVQGVWRARRNHMVDLCNQVEQMKGRFLQFQIIQVLRKFNTDADAQAKSATKLPVGAIQEQSDITF